MLDLPRKRKLENKGKNCEYVKPRNTRGFPIFAQFVLKMTTQKEAVLVLEDGTTCYGQAFGAVGTTGGEICFNTGMTGYQEVFTDPSYFGQVLIMNAVHVGNYGVADIDVESDSIKIKGLIGRNLEELFSRRMAQMSLDEYLKLQNIVAIEGVDTRAL